MPRQPHLSVCQLYLFPLNKFASELVHLNHHHQLHLGPALKQTKKNKFPVSLMCDVLHLPFCQMDPNFLSVRTNRNFLRKCGREFIGRQTTICGKISLTFRRKISLIHSSEAKLRRKYIFQQHLSRSLFNPCKSIAHLQRAPKHINRGQDIISLARFPEEEDLYSKAWWVYYVRRQKVKCDDGKDARIWSAGGDYLVKSARLPTNIYNSQLCLQCIGCIVIRFKQVLMSERGIFQCERHCKQCFFINPLLLVLAFINFERAVINSRLPIINLYFIFWSKFCLPCFAAAEHPSLYEPFLISTQFELSKSWNERECEILQNELSSNVANIFHFPSSSFAWK